MRLCTFSTDAFPQHVGLALPGQRLLDVSAAWPGDPRFASLLGVIQHEDETLPMLRGLLASAQTPPGCLHDLKDVRIGLPYQPPQIRCFSVYEQHLKNAFRQVAANVAPVAGAAAGAMQIPPAFYETPVYYKGVRLNLSGPGASVRRPEPGTKLDYEAELAVVIGRGGKNIAASAAMGHVFGYVVFNDFSERAQLMKELRSGVGTGPAKGKDFDGSNSLGPWIVTADEIPDPHALDVTVRVNGQVRGQGSTSGMTHRVDRIVSFASQNETLHPGELLATGCVPDCAGIEQWCFLEDGDRVEVEIAGLGVLENTVVAT
ncbi:fumarylacetoacetate hydrolase family protein [Acidovorax cavernicola]|uniref:Fumarylacetoacetate hydrolase family protein n=1 Tax=Acidovorax cavernicola TaxID=1675792 RepID=A0A9X8D998_9BURK|nr:fumarylacetoacetate hydrolase family protein [Acidovorax cavernicola]RIX85036.1 fumarylacetoacetate hydrolase family protein [Acidovorax cavernicola]